MAAAVRVAVVAVLLMQCCGVILAARPLSRDDAAAEHGRDDEWQLGQQAAAGAQLQVAAHQNQNQMKMSLPVPGKGNPSGWEDVNHHSASTTPVGPGIANNDSATPP